MKTSGMIIQMAFVGVTRIYQTEIRDKWASKLCMWLCEMWMAWSLLRFIALQEGKTPPAPFTKADLDRLNDECIKSGGLARLTDDDSDNGFVKDHEKNAECVGLKGFKKIYEPIGDSSKVVNLVQWGAICELRDDGRHSMLAIGWYMEGDKVYLNMFDPWKASNDGRFDCARKMTQRQNEKGEWVDSRSVESFAWYYKVGTNPRWIS